MRNQTDRLSRSPATASHGAPTLIGHVYELLRQDIIAGRYAPEERLRVEHLRGEHQVAASTMREALSRLLAEGLVTMEGQRGFRVAPMSLEDLEDITRLRVIIEKEAMSDAIRCGDLSWESGVVAAFHALSRAEKALKDGADNGFSEAIAEWERRNAAFHKALMAACNSPRLRVLQETLYQQHERYRRRALELRTPHQDRPAAWPRDVHAEHLALKDAAVNREEAEALRLIEEHIRSTATAVAHGFNVSQA